MRHERGLAHLELALWAGATLFVAGVVGYIVLDSARAKSSSTYLSPAQTRYVESVATQQAERYISAIATQAAAPVPPAAPSPTAPAPAAPVPTAQPSMSRPPASPPIPPPAQPPPSPPAPAPTAVPPPAQPPAALRFTAERVRSVILTPLSLYVSGTYEDTAPTFCNLGLFYPQTDMWMVSCVVRINPGVEDPQGVIVFVNDGTGHVYCVKGCSFFPTCLPTALGCEWLSTVSP